MTFRPFSTAPGRYALAGMVVGMVVSVSAPAAAYVRARTTDTFMPIFWSDPRKVLEVARPPDGLGISTDDLRGAAQAAVGAWSNSSIACTGVALRLASQSADSQTAGRDGRNRIIMRTGNWCRDPIALTHCHDPAAVALTTVFSRSRPGASDDGEMLEADIEVNAAGAFQWGIVPDGPFSGRDFANIYDLTSALTHETGHFIGLDHTCVTPGARPLVDDRGIGTFSCGTVSATEQSLVEDATMYPFMNPADISLRTLTPDDARAACDIYPIASVPDDEWVGAGGCSEAPGSPPRSPGQVLVSIFLLIMLGWFSRLARRPGRSRFAPNSLPTPRNIANFYLELRLTVVRAATPRNDS